MSCHKRRYLKSLALADVSAAPPPPPEPEVCVYGGSDASHFPPLRHPFLLSSKAAIVVERLIRVAIRKKVQLVLKVGEGRRK